MASKARPCILAINGGSSSVKFAVYQADAALERIAVGKVERIGLPGTTLTIAESKRHAASKTIDATNNHEALGALFDALESVDGFAGLLAVGHRVVHGMAHSEPETITPELIQELKTITPYDPDHLPGEIEVIEAVAKRHPGIAQVACFDTAFHRTMPRVAKLLPIPRRFDAQGIQRYGFHGLSYAFLVEELVRIGDQAATKGRVILAHLGSGASMAAVVDGKSVDTSMAFTPAAGLVMGTRTGDLDPGLAYYLEKAQRMTPKKFQEMVNHDSGLKGVSETSSDMQDLLAKESEDQRAAEAVELFCYQAKKWVGSLAAAMGGLDTLVFSGGIGENSPAVRQRICAGMSHLGIEIDETRNDSGESVVSRDAARVYVRVIKTDEELMIARSVARVIGIE